MPRNAALVACAILPLLAACQTQEQTGGLLGAGGGALIGGLAGGAIGHGAGALIGGALGAAGGYFVGSTIGRQLDDRDRARAQAATQRLLNEPVHYPPTQTAAATPPKPRAKTTTASWSSDHNQGVHGSATLVDAQQTTGGECRTVREVAYVGGQETTQNTRYCRGADREWVAQS